MKISSGVEFPFSFSPIACLVFLSIISINFYLLADGGFVSKKKKPVVCHSLVLTDIEGRSWKYM